MNDFVRKFLTEWRKLGLPFENETIIAAVSGGADSVSLLLALYELRTRKKLKNRFIIAHFNHNLRGEESEKDLEFVRSLTRKFNFEFICKTHTSHSNLQHQKGNLEQNARISRYEFLQEISENLRAFAVLTAHTLNDQAETFLINLLRGSGLEGLGGMKQIRNLSNEKTEKKREDILYQTLPILVRPLITWAKREDTENFCRSQNINVCYDTMNEDLAFQRVRIRKVLLPLLKDFNPKIIESLAKTAFLLQTDFEELNSFFEGNRNTFETDILILKDIQNLSTAVLRRGLRHWLEQNRGNVRNLDKKHFDSIENLILSKKSGRIAELPNGESVLKQNGKLVFQSESLDNEMK